MSSPISFTVVQFLDAILERYRDWGVQKREQEAVQLSVLRETKQVWQRNHTSSDTYSPTPAQPVDQIRIHKMQFVKFVYILLFEIQLRIAAISLWPKF